MSEQNPTGPASGGRDEKSPQAFRTISEVSTDIGVPQHVLRFWETKFAQIKPLKRAGGRRYYRPEDVATLRQVRDWLYTDGYTIKGVQKRLREGALREDAPDHVSQADLDTAPPQAMAPGVETVAEPSTPARPAGFARDGGGPRSGLALSAEARAELRSVAEGLAALRDRLRTEPEA
jgi:DNA-binding transcriptional MerR regulator